MLIMKVLITALVLAALSGCNVPAESRVAIYGIDRDIRVIIALCGGQLDGVELYAGSGEAEETAAEWVSSSGLRDGQSWSVLEVTPPGEWSLVRPVDPENIDRFDRLTISGFTSDNSNAAVGFDFSPSMLDELNGVIMDLGEDGDPRLQEADPESWSATACET